MKNAIVFQAKREGYGIDQLNSPMTIGQLKELIADLDDDTLFILGHDNNYTFGSISRNNFEEWEEVDGEWQELR